jgi:hypothetical protein
MTHRTFRVGVNLLAVLDVLGKRGGAKQTNEHHNESYALHAN